MKTTVLMFVCLLILGCKKSTKPSTEEIENFKKRVTLSGDIKAFSRLILYYNGKENYYDLIPYSIIMSNKYNSPDGYYHVYSDFIRLNNNGKYSEKLIVNLPKENQDFVLSYLTRGAEANDIDCKATLAKHYKFGYGVPKDEKVSDSIMNSIKHNQ